MENGGSQSAAEIVMAWLPFVIYVGTWIWGVNVFKRYARNREVAALKATEATQALIETNRQIVIALQELRKREN